MSTYFVNGGVRLSKPVLQDILQRVRRDGEVGELVDEREDPGAAHGDARDAGVALRLAGLREDLHAVAFGAAVKQTVVEQIVFQVQRRALLGLDIFGVDQTFISHSIFPPRTIEPYRPGFENRKISRDSTKPPAFLEAPGGKISGFGEKSCDGEFFVENFRA